MKSKMSIKIAVKDAQSKQKLENIIDMLSGLSRQRYDDPARMDLLILELSREPENEFKLIHKLLSADAVGEVFLLSSETDQDILLKAMKAGVKEFFALPFKEDEVVQALQQFIRRHQHSGINGGARQGRILNVIGTKGGVGTTTVAVNLAASLANRADSLSVALIDMNMVFGEIPLFMDLKPKYHWGEITKNMERLDAVFLSNVLSAHPSGVHVLSSPGYLNGHPGTTPAIMENLLPLMQSMFDVVVIDCGPSLNDTTLRIVELSDQTLLITLLSLPCLSNVSKFTKSLEEFGVRSTEGIQVIVNRFLKKSEISLQDAEMGIRQPIFWTIPNDYKTTMAAINQGKTLGELAAKAPITKNFNELARALLPDEQTQDKKRWSLFRRG